MRFIYDIVTDIFVENKLDKDSLSILKKYSIFYTKMDYDLLLKELKNHFNKYDENFYNFLITNLYLSNIFDHITFMYMFYIEEMFTMDLNGINEFIVEKLKNKISFDEDIITLIVNYYNECLDNDRIYTCSCIIKNFLIEEYKLNFSELEDFLKHSNKLIESDKNNIINYFNLDLVNLYNLQDNHPEL